MDGSEAEDYDCTIDRSIQFYVSLGLKAPNALRQTMIYCTGLQSGKDSLTGSLDFSFDEMF